MEVAHAAPRSSAAGITPAQRYGINHAADAREPRQPATPPNTGVPVLPVALGAGALVLGAVLLLGNGSAPAKTTRTPAAGKDERIAANDAAKPAPINASAAVEPAGNPNTPIPAVPAKPASPGPDADTNPLPVNKGPNPEQLAQEALDKALKFEGIPPEDKEGRIKVLNAYLAVYGNSMVSTRAWQLVKSLRAEIDHEAHERQLAASMPPSIITGSIETDSDSSKPGGREKTEMAGHKEPGENPAGASRLKLSVTAGSGAGGAAVPARADEKAPRAMASAPKAAAGKSADDKPEPKRMAEAAPVNPAAQAQLEAVRKELAPILQQHRFGAALELLDGKLTDAGATDARDLLQVEKADLNGVLQLRQAAIDAVRQLAGRKITLKRGKTELTGIVNVDPARPGIVLKSDSGLEMTFAPDQLQAQDIDTFAPLRTGAEKAGDLRARGIMFYDIGELAKAQEVLKAAQDAGADVASYLDRIGAAAEEGIESRARADFASAESAYQLKRYESAQKAFQAFKATYGKTKTFAQLEPQLKLRLDAIEFTLHPLADGLIAKYYRNHDLKDEDMQLERIDDKIDFNWDRQSPASNVPHDDFCARWTGVIRIDRGGKYTFTTIVDDNARLWIDGKLVINDWGSGHGAKAFSGAIELPEGFYDLKLEFRQYTGPAVIRLRWALKDTFSETLVPPDVLFHRQPHKSNDK